MRNKFNEWEQITEDDVLYVSYMLEYIARRRHLQNFEVLNCISKDYLYHILSCASVYHCQNPEDVCSLWVKQFNVPTGNFHFDNVDPSLNVCIPTEMQIGKLFCRLIMAVAMDNGLLQAFYDVFNNPITIKINDYNASAFYEPYKVQLKAYYDKHF